MSAATPVDGNLKNELGRKKDQLQLFPVAGIREGATAMVEGAGKYGPFNWRYGRVELMQYVGAVLRHAYAIADGEWIDSESAVGKTHLAGILASAAIIADAKESSVLDLKGWPGDTEEFLRDIPS